MPGPKKRHKSADPIRDRLARRVRELREGRGLSQAEQARACGLSHVFYGTVERAVRSVGLESLELLARGHGMEPWELMRFEGASTPALSPAERMGQRVAALGRGASPTRLAQFERLARVFFEEP